MSFILQLLTAFFRALLPWLARESRPTAEDADPDRETREKLRKKVRNIWLITLLIVLVPNSAGCIRTVYVEHGTPVRLRETIRNAKVWVKDSNGEVVAGKMDLLEGWYALSLDDSEK